MDTFLPSEISRLIYGYLYEHCGQNFAEEYSKLCETMRECTHMKQKYARNFHTTIQDLTLETILDQYSKLCSLIFMHTGEEHIYKNILDLLNKILNERQELLGQVSIGRVFKDVQNLPLERNNPSTFINIVAEGIENELSFADKPIENNLRKHKISKQFSNAKKKPAGSPATLARNSNALTQIDNSNIRSISPVLKPNRIVESKQNSENSILLNCRNIELVQRKTNGEILIKGTSCTDKHKKFVFDLSSNVEETEASKNSSNKFRTFHPSLPLDDQTIKAAISSSPLEIKISNNANNMEIKTDIEFSSCSGIMYDTNHIAKETINFESTKSDCNNIPSISSNPSICVNNSFAKNGTDINRKSQSLSGNSLSILSHEVLPDEDQVSSKNFITYENTEKRNQAADGNEEVEILLSKSIKSDTMGKIMFKNHEEKSFTLSHNIINESSNARKNNDNLESSNKFQARKLNELNLSEECQSIFDTLSKNFKRRSPFSSPAKFNEPLATNLSPLSQMYVTPTKPYICQNVKFNIPINTSVANGFTSDCCDIPDSSVDGMKSSRLQNQSPQIKVVNEKFADMKTSSRKQSVLKTIFAKQAEATPQHLQSSTFMKKTDCALSTVAKILTENEGLEIKSLESETNASLKPSLESKAMRSLTNKRIKRDNLLHVFIPDTDEIAELDITAELVHFHRDSTCLVFSFSS